MEIVAISDLHGYLPEDVGSGDVLIIAGDLCPDFISSREERGNTAQVTKQVAWLSNEFSNWMELQYKKFNYVIATPGNHDFIRSLSVEQYHAIKYNFCGDDLYLEPKTINIDGFLFYVSPFCLKLPGWAYTLTEEELWGYYREIPIGVDVVVSHGPAENILDRCVDGRRVGSRALKSAIRRSQPSIVICGHIHESYGKYEMSHAGTSHKTKIYNVAQRDEAYTYINRPVKITLDKPRLDFTL